ncbi:MAG: pilus assembly protein [Elusimicrobia bacterium]|nr:pilus assembly protein [Elusimicrobiota bacterium]
MRARSRSGQVVVEMLLILPVFLAMVFLIMEIGYLAFRVIMLNHATYETARVGSMTWAFPSLGSGLGPSKTVEVMKRLLPAARVDCAPEATLVDPQALQQNYDLVCRGEERVRLIFPLSSFLLANPRGSGRRLLAATVRMPIEQPLRK